MDYLEVLEKQIKVLEGVQEATDINLPEVKVKIAFCIATMIGQIDYMLSECDGE